jgi:hypothetical protein
LAREYDGPRCSNPKHTRLYREVRSPAWIPSAEIGASASENQTEILTPGVDRHLNMRTNFVPDAALTPEEVVTVVALAESCGVGHVASVESLHYFPSTERGIIVTGLEQTSGRKVIFKTVEVFREGWAYKSDSANTRSNGQFWIDLHQPPIVHELTIFSTPQGTARVELGSGVPIDIADRVIKAFTTRRITYSGNHTQDECNGANFIRPNWLGKSDEAGLYEISFSGGLNRYRFKLADEEVEIVFVIYVSV